jgi:hypothetical protein
MAKFSVYDDMSYQIHQVLGIYHAMYRRHDCHIDPVTEEPVFILYEQAVPVGPDAHYTLNQASGESTGVLR